VSLKTVVAAAFKHLRKDKLQKVEFIYYISIDRKWMNKDQAALLLERAREDDLITQRDGAWVPTFDPEDVEIPLGFRPTADVLESRGALEELVADIAKQTGTDQKSIYAEMNTIIRDGFAGKLLPEAAVVIIARRYRVPCDNYIDELRKEVVKESLLEKR